MENFIDYVKIFCHSGKGGNGSVHFHRDKMTRKGGPDGGDGGRGGNIILRGNKQLWTLLHLKYRKHISAEDGKNGSALLCTGASAEDVVIEVPLGTVVKNENVVLFEILDDQQMQTLLPCGRGGLGNNHFKSPTNQTPRYAQIGENGQEGWFILELKLLADVGLVGFPNAGKSTLLSVLSAAKPKIADYPFTTLKPNLGIVAYQQQQSFVMADIPGIMEGAAHGKGLGTRFLRHIERNSCLLFCISADCDDINKEYRILYKELEMYNPELLHKKRFLAITKSDLIDIELQQLLLTELNIDIPYIFISSFSKYNLLELTHKLWNILNENE